MLHHLNSVVICAMVFSVSTVQAQGVPVIDAANLAQAVQQVAAWQQQLQGMYQQYQQQVAQFKALTGARGFGDILANPLLQKYLPVDMQGMYKGVMSGNLSQVAAATRQQQLIYDCLSEKNERSQSLCRAQLEAPYAVKDLFQNIYKGTQEQIEQLKKLQAQINLTQDPKAIAELQARIQSEQAQVQTAMMQAQVVTKLAEIEAKLVEQKRAELTLETVSSNKALQIQPATLVRAK